MRHRRLDQYSFQRIGEGHALFNYEPVKLRETIEIEIQVGKMPSKSRPIEEHIYFGSSEHRDPGISESHWWNLLSQVERAQVSTPYRFLSERDFKHARGEGWFKRAGLP